MEPTVKVEDAPADPFGEAEFAAADLERSRKLAARVAEEVSIAHQMDLDAMRRAGAL